MEGEGDQENGKQTRVSQSLNLPIGMSRDANRTRHLLQGCASRRRLTRPVSATLHEIIEIGT